MIRLRREGACPCPYGSMEAGKAGGDGEALVRHVAAPATAEEHLFERVPRRLKHDDAATPAQQLGRAYGAKVARRAATHHRQRNRRH